VSDSTNPEPLGSNPQEAASPAPLPEYFDAETDTLNAPMVLFGSICFVHGGPHISNEGLSR